MSERPSPQVTAGTSRGWRIPGKHDLAVEGRNIGRVVVSTFTDNLPYDWVCVTVSDVTGLDDSYFDGHTEAELDAISGERRNALGGPNLDQTVLAFQLNDGPTVPAASTTLNPVKFLDHADWTTDTNPEPADGPASICRHATVTLRHQDGLVIVRARTEQPANVAWSVNCGTPGILPQPGPAHPRIRFIEIGDSTIGARRYISSTGTEVALSSNPGIHGFDITRAVFDEIAAGTLPATLTGTEIADEIRRRTAAR